MHSKVKIEQGFRLLLCNITISNLAAQQLTTKVLVVSSMQVTTAYNIYSHFLFPVPYSLT